MKKDKISTNNKLDNVQCRVNDKAPALGPGLVMKPRLLNHIALYTRLLDLDNVALLHKLYKIHVTHGRTSSFRTKPIPMGRTNFQLRQKEALIIERDNKKLDGIIENIKPCVLTTEELAKKWKIAKKEIDSKMKWPKLCVKQKISENVAVRPPPSDIVRNVTEKSFKFSDKRPRVCIKLFLKNHGWIGKMFAVLYSDYEPELCQQFLNLSGSESDRNCTCNNVRISYIFPEFFCTLEGILNWDDIGRRQERSHLLHHGETAVLTVRRTETNRFSFLITFQPLPFMDSKYTAFGKITKGFDTVRAIESFGSKAGHALKELSIKINEI